MSALTLRDGAPWSARVEACPWTPVTRTDLLVSLALFAGSVAITGYLGFVVGALVAGMFSLGPWAGALGLAIPVLWIGGLLGVDLVLRSLVYEITDEGEALRIQVSRRGIGRVIPIPLERTGGVALPTPWPAAVVGTVHDFRLPKAAMRGFEVHPHAIVLHLSAERVIQLAIRGHTAAGLAPLVERLAA